MNEVNDVIRLILAKYKAMPEDKSKRYTPGIQLVLGWLAAVESTGDLIRTCADCRHAYVPKHAKDDTVYCSEVNQMKTLSGYCDWFQEEK